MRKLANTRSVKVPHCSAPAVWIETTPHKSARAIIIQIRKSFYETRMNWNLKFPGLERGEEIAGLGWIKGKLALELKTTTFHRIWAAASNLVQVLVWEVLLADICWLQYHFAQKLLVLEKIMKICTRWSSALYYDESSLMMNSGCQLLRMQDSNLGYCVSWFLHILDKLCLMIVCQGLVKT